MTEPDEDLRRNIRRRRIICGWTEQDMADRLGVSRVTYNKYERGKAKIDDDTIYRLSTILGISMCRLFDPSVPKCRVLFWICR